MNPDNKYGLQTASGARSVDEACRRVHAIFCASHDVSAWPLSVFGLQHPAVSVTSTPPDGHASTTIEITLAPGFDRDLLSFLESQYAAWDKRNAQAKPR